jgi:WD40 repeat protein
VGDGEGGVAMLDPGSGEVTSRLETALSGRVWTVAVAPDGAAVAAGDDVGNVVLVTPDGATEQPLGTHAGAVAAVAFNPDGTVLASGGREDGVVKFWDVEDGELRAETPAGSAGVGGLAWTPNGSGVVATDLAGSVRVWDTAGQPVAGPVEVDRDAIWGVDVSPDGATVAVATADDVVSLWPASLDAGPLAKISDLEGDATDVGFLDGGLLLVSATRDGAVRLWDGHTGAAVGASMAGHDAETWSLAVHPDGLHFATTATDGSVRIWDVLALDRACELTADLVLDEQLRLIGEDAQLEGCGSPS